MRYPAAAVMDNGSLLILLLLVAVCVVPFLALLGRANELFVLSVRDGQVEVVRGRVPKSLLRDARDVLRGIKSAEIRATLEGGLPMVRGEGLPPEQLQRLRNVVGRFSRAQIKSAPRK